MQIICPNCGTSYSVTVAALGPDGRNVRCAKCKEVWLATPHDAIVHAAAAAAAGGDPAGPVQDSSDPVGPVAVAERADWGSDQPPLVESPSIVNDAFPEPAIAAAPIQNSETEIVGRPPRGFGRGAIGPARPRLKFNLSVALAAMGALALGLIVWRADIVRLLPQTASFFKLAGMTINLRHLNFENVAVSSETVNGAPVLIIDGFVASASAKPVEIPRLRLVVRDARGEPIYAWNAVLEQAVLQPGERVPFKTRLAAPPANAHDLIVRFFNKRDIAAGGA